MLFAKSFHNLEFSKTSVLKSFYGGLISNHRKLKQLLLVMLLANLHNSNIHIFTRVISFHFQWKNPSQNRLVCHDPRDSPYTPTIDTVGWWVQLVRCCISNSQITFVEAIPLFALLVSVRLCYRADVKLTGFRSSLEAFCMSNYTDELWYNETVCLEMTIYTPTLRGLSTLSKELMGATRVMQSSSNELSAPVSVRVKCKQMSTFNTYTLNSLA